MDSADLHFSSNSEATNEDLAFEQMALRPSLRLWWIYLFGFGCVLVVKLTLLLELPDLEWPWRMTVLGGALTLLYLFLKRRLTVYRLNAIELIGREGVFTKRVTRIPLNRVTNYDTHASLLDRLLGLNNIFIDTPGGTGYEMALKQLDQYDAQLLSGRLRKLLAQQKIADAGHNQQLRAVRQRAMIG